MPSDFQKSGDFRLKGWHVFIGFAAFFGTIIIVNLTMATFASKTWTGLIVQNSYVASQKFNDELAAAAAQKKLGWHSKLHYEAGHLVISVDDANGKAIKFDQFTVKIGRPAFEQKDQTLDMLFLGAGTYVDEIRLDEGEWLIKIFGQKDGLPYRRDARLLIHGDKASIIK